MMVFFLFCSDIDGCVGHACNNLDVSATCNDVEAPGLGYTCTCTVPWFEYNAGTFTCDDVEECLTSPCAVNASCSNSIGSFSCDCNDGYFGDGFTCDPSSCPTAVIADGSTTPADGNGVTLDALSLSCDGGFLVTPTGVSSFACVPSLGSPNSEWNPVLSTCEAPVITGIGATPTLNTNGNEVITLQGSRLGDFGSSTVSATYGPTGVEYVATACAVSNDNVVIQCLSAAGVGTSHVWRVTVAYCLPSIGCWLHKSALFIVCCVLCGVCVVCCVLCCAVCCVRSAVCVVRCAVCCVLFDV